MMADYMIYLDWTLAPHSHSIDIPASYRHSEDYSASLAHKVVDDKNIYTRTKIFAGQPQFPAQLLFRAGAAPGVRADVPRHQDAEGRGAGRGDLRQLQILARTRARLVHRHHQQQLKYRYSDLVYLYVYCPVFEKSQSIIIPNFPSHA